MIKASNRTVLIINVFIWIFAILLYFILGGTITKRGQPIDPSIKNANLLASSMSLGIWASLILLTGAMTGKLGIKTTSEWLDICKYPSLFYLMMIFYAIMAMICFVVYGISK